MDKIKPMVNKTAPSNAIPIVTSLSEVDDPSKGDMVISTDSLGGLVLYLHDGSQFNPVSGGVTPVSSKEGIWTLYNNTLPTVRTSTDLTVFDEVVIDMDLFNSVEQDFQGNITVDNTDEMAFTPAHSNAYEIQIHGTITEPNTSFSSILLVQLFDDNTNAPMTGSVQSVAPAWNWSGGSRFSFNCVGFGRLNTGSKVRLQLASNAATSYTLTDCIVILKPLD